MISAFRSRHELGHSFLDLLAQPGYAEALALAASSTPLLDTADVASAASATATHFVATHFATNATMASSRHARVSSVFTTSAGRTASSGSATAADARTLGGGVGRDDTEAPPRSKSRLLDRAVNGRLSAHAATFAVGRRLSAPTMALRVCDPEQSVGEHCSRLRLNETPNAPPPRRRLVVEAAYTPASLGLCL